MFEAPVPFCSAIASAKEKNKWIDEWIKVWINEWIGTRGKSEKTEKEVTW